MDHARTTRALSRRWVWAIGAVLALALAVAACGSDDDSDDGGGGGGGGQAEQGPQVVNAAYLPIASGAALFVAEDQGFFADEGIKNDLTTVANIYDLLQPMDAGDIDVNLVGTAAAFLNAVNSGLGVRYAVDRMKYTCSSDTPLLVRSELWDEGVRSVADLKGKTVAVFALGSVAQYWLDRALADAGMTEKDLKQVVALSFPDTANALKTGAVDAGFVGQPVALDVLKSGDAKVLANPYEIVPDQQAGEWAMSQSFLEQDDGALAAKWIAAYLKGVRYYLDPANKDSVVQTIAKWTEVDPAVVEELYGTDNWPYMDPNGEVDTDAIGGEDAQWMLDNELIEKVPEPSEYYDDSALQAALEEVGRVDVERDCADVKKLDVGR